MFEYSKNKDIVFVDVEANDKPKRLLQFGAIKLKTDGTIQEVNLFSNPKCKISKHVTDIVKNNYENIVRGESNTKVMKAINKFVNNCIFISYSPFDYNFLNKLHLSLFKRKLNVDFIDLQDEWRKLNLSKNVWGLQKLADFFKIEYSKDNFHDALYDAKITYEIFMKWKNYDEKLLIGTIYQDKLKKETSLKSKQNKHKDSLTINNLNFTNGYAFIDVKFKTIKFSHDLKEKLISNIDVVEIQNNFIKRNWSFSYDFNLKEFDKYQYINELTNKLKQYIISIRYKKIVIFESKLQDIIRLANVCSQYINVFPLNKILYCNGFEQFYNKIDLTVYKFHGNLELIKKWLVYQYLDNLLQEN